MAMKRATSAARILVVFALACGLAACSAGGGPGAPPLRVVNFNFAPGFGGVHLNAPLVLTFSTLVDPATVTRDSIRIITTTTTTAEPDPGAPAVGTYVVSGNVVTFLPRIPRRADLADAGLRIGFTYAVQVPAPPLVIEPLRTPSGDPNVITFQEEFSTINHTILPAPQDITAETNLNTLQRYFIDEGIQNGVDPCDRATLPPADRDSPQVVDSDPDEGESGFGTITGIEPGLGTAFVRLDPIRLVFSEPIAPWRIRPQNVTIRNTNLGGETFDLFFFFTQDRSNTVLQITVFDADSAFDQASVPQGRYVLSLTDFSDLAGNPLVNSATCVADGTFNLSFSTVSSPALPTDIVLSFQDDDQEGHVDIGGLATAANNPNEVATHEPPFLGGFAFDTAPVPSPSLVTTNANPGNVAFWTGREMRYDNGFRPNDSAFQVPASLRLRGGSNTAATAVLAPIAGAGVLPGNATQAGRVIVGAGPDAGKTDFQLIGPGTIAFFTGDLTTGPIVYHYRRFELKETGGGRPTLTYTPDSVFPMVILVEDDAEIWGDIRLDGTDGEFGFNGDNGGATLSRNPGGRGGRGGPGGGAGGNGGSFNLGTQADLHGTTGGVPASVLGPLTQLSEAVAGLSAMATGGGGHCGVSQPPANNIAYQGGGGGGAGSAGTRGFDWSAAFPGESDQGEAGKQVGNSTYTTPSTLPPGGAGGGGGGADDDGPAVQAGNGLADSFDDGGGGGGGGGGLFALAARGNITLGDAAGPSGLSAFISCLGGRGGSTYATVFGDPPQPGAGPTPNFSANFGEGEAGGGGAGGGIILVCGGSMTFNRARLFALGKRGGNSPAVEGGNRSSTNEAGGGGGGAIFLADGDGINLATEILNNPDVLLVPPGADPLSNQVSSNPGVITVGVYGDEAREPLFGRTRIVTEFFDTLSDSVSYDEVRTLSNANLFPSGTIRVFLDATTGGGGFPVLTDEQVDGTLGLGASPGATIEIPLTYDPNDGVTDLGTPQSETRFVIPAAAPTLGKRYARVRIEFDVSLLAATPDQILGVFAPPGAPPAVVAPGNSRGNIDTAPQGVPAVADLRVRFTP
jgi:hypothetical protein